MNNLIKRTVIPGVIWTLVVAAAFAWSATLVSVLAASLAGIGWLVLVALGGARHVVPRESTRVADSADSARASVVSLQQALVESGRQFERQFVELREEAGRVQSLLGDAIAKLTDSFHGMHVTTDRQQQLALSITFDSNDSTKHADFDAFVSSTSGWADADQVAARDPQLPDRSDPDVDHGVFGRNEAPRACRGRNRLAGQALRSAKADRSSEKGNRLKPLPMPMSSLGRP